MTIAPEGRKLLRIEARNTETPIERKPEWIKTRANMGPEYTRLRSLVKSEGLHTVCQEARCPNIHDCWASGDATFMIAGQECTRGCRFCAVGTIKTPPPLDVEEPTNLANAVESMNLRHAVITVVNRDDLADSGADHYKQCIEAVHKRQPQVTLELLCSDLAGDHEALAHLLEGSPLSVFAHNVECVPRLDATVRDHRASFSQSLEILRAAKQLRPDILTKSSIMVGVGETDEEITETLGMLKEAGVDLVTIGQYLAPSDSHLPIEAYYTPQQFDELKAYGESIGFKHVASGPLVRSSYHADVQASGLV